MADTELMDKIAQGKERWNSFVKEMRLQDESWGANLKSADLSRRDLRGYDFRNSDLRSATLAEANADTADFSFARFERCTFAQGSFKEAKFREADLRRANLALANLSGADLWKAKLIQAHLVKTILKEANLEWAQFEGANLKHADLTGANLIGCKSILLDYSVIRNARWSFHSKDPWNVLRRTYTGPQFTVILLFTVSALVPYLAKAGFWQMAGAAEASMLDYTNTLKDELIDRLGSISDELVNSSNQELAHFGAEIEKEASALAEWSPSFKSGWRRTRVGAILLGLGRTEASIDLLPLLIFAYTITRAFLTFRLSSMREELDISGHAPALSVYYPLYRIHCAITPLYYLALGASAFSVIRMFSQVVYMP